MTNIDQFESAFKAADRTLFQPESIDVQTVLVVTDTETPEAEQLAERVRKWLPPASTGSPPNCRVVSGRQYAGVQELLDVIEQHQPDLICTYRNLHIPSAEFPFSLGVYVDVLTQATTTPVLLLPRPERESAQVKLQAAANTVMAITDHLTGDDHLVSFAARFTHRDGALILAHVEDKATLERYLNTIGKIPAIDTEVAREEIMHQLLKEPRDYVDSCRQVLDDGSAPFRVETLVDLGHRLNDYKRLIEEHQVDLVVMNTKDDDQLAMHGLAYPLAVELRDLPLLLL